MFTFYPKGTSRVLRFTPLLALLALVLAALACGVSTGHFCRQINNAGACSLSLSRLSGSHTQTFDAGAAGTGLPVEVTLTVESGSARVSFLAPDGSTVSAEATAGSSVTFTGVAAVSPNGAITITVESIGGEATGVEATVEFTNQGGNRSQPGDQEA